MPSPRAAAALILSALAAEPAGAARYPDAVARLAKDRAEYAAQYQKAKAKERPEILSRARERLAKALDEDLVPAWYGTPWEFYGVSETPGAGTIACGYFVSTVLRDAGLRVERVRLAQQASEYIVRSLAPAARILRLKNQSNAQVVEEVRKQGDGWYVVGLDYHVGFIRIDGEAARFCHSSYLGTKAVVCEAPETAGALASTLHVVGPAFPDARVVDWLLQRPVATALPRRGSR
ncbi:MAG TPA: hypothetical protein VGK67_12100 [Myxococcales bacterium]|jgi:hypothetical protein